MQVNDVKTQLSGYLNQDDEKHGSFFIRSIRKAFTEGRLDHNYIRKAIIDGFKLRDHKAVLVGSLMLQLDHKDLNHILNEEIS